jgi:hypothetical protein
MLAMEDYVQLCYIEVYLLELQADGTLHERARTVFLSELLRELELEH